MQRISQFIQNQFPAFYQEEGPDFIRFMEAYYEFLEDNHQYLTIEDTTGFSAGDTITQGDATGTIISISDDSLLVQVTSDDIFRCKTLCSDLTVLSNGTEETYVTLAQAVSPIHMARMLQSYRDIDTTIDAFIDGFKEKYLKNIEFDTETNTKLLVKNSLDLYRAKGSERAVDLFFKLVYGTKGEVYVPGRDLFRLSDGQWTRPVYLEVTNSRRNVSMVGRKVVGTLSGASGFVEKFIRRRVTGDYVAILYMSDISGEFRNGEPLAIDGSTVYTDAPRVLGSVTSLEITSAGSGFAIGDIVDIQSDKGLGGKGRVTGIANTTGAVDFIFVDGGWGYTVNAESIVSEKVISLTDVEVPNTSLNRYFTYFETAEQPLANVAYNTATFTGEATGFTDGDTISFANSSGGTIGTGIILISNNEVSSNLMSGNGHLRVSVTSNTVASLISDTAEIVLTSNTDANASVTSIVDWTVSGIVMGIPDEATLTVNDRTDSFQIGDEVYQAVGGTRYGVGIVNRIVQAGASSYLSVDSLEGVFTKSQKIFVTGNTKTANLQQVDLTVGVYQITGANSGSSFLENFSPKFSTINTTGDIFSVSEGTDASFGIGSIGETETIFINTDLISGNNTGYYQANGAYVNAAPFSSLALNAYGYGFPRNPQGNLTSTIASLLSFDSFTVGSISTLNAINPGEGYDTDPYVLVRQPYVSAFNRKDFIIGLGSTAGYQVGERVLQSNTSIATYQLGVGNTIAFNTGDAVYSGASYDAYDVAGIVVSVANSSHLIVSQTDGTWVVTDTLKNSQYAIKEVVYEDLTGALANDQAFYVTNSTPSIVGSGIIVTDDATDTLVIGLMEGTISSGNRLFLSGNNANFANVVSVTDTDPTIASATLSSITVTAKGLIKEVSNGTSMKVSRISFENYFEAGETLVGQSTGASSTIASVAEDEDSLPIGWNAVIEANVTTANGTVSTMAVADSGYGYTNGSIVTFTSSNGLNSGSVRVVKSGHGTGTGYFKTTRGFLSADKYLLDSDFYQEYSYQVISRIPFDKYRSMFMDAIHLAGTKLFGAVLLESKETNAAVYADSAVTQEED